MITAAARSSSAPMLVAASVVGAVEALKDQAGLCRWNYAMRSVYQHASNRASAAALSAKDCAGVSVVSSRSSLGKENESGGSTGTGTGGGYSKGRRSEEKLQKAYYLICWGPN